MFKLFDWSDPIDDYIKMLDEQVKLLRFSVDQLKEALDKVVICKCGGTCSCHTSKKS